MYTINRKRKLRKEKITNLDDLTNVKGFPMASPNKKYKIQGCIIRKINIVNKRLANPLVSKKVLKKYNKLISYLTELLIDDDDSGETFREALNQIEKFRMEIKNKYREFLKRKELEMMSKQLTALKREANKRLLEIAENYQEYLNNRNKGR